MNLDRIARCWKQLKGMTRDYGVRRANEKQLAEWLARQHKVDPLHK